MKKLILLSIGLCMGAIATVNAQSVPPTPPDQNGPVPVPVDGGASLLLAAGAAYGAKKVKAFKAKKAEKKAMLAAAAR